MGGWLGLRERQRLQTGVLGSRREMLHLPPSPVPPAPSEGTRDSVAGEGGEPWAASPVMGVLPEEHGKAGSGCCLVQEEGANLPALGLHVPADDGQGHCCTGSGGSGRALLPSRL